VQNIIGVNVAASSYQSVTGQVIDWASRGESRTVVFANVHVLMEAHDDPELRRKLNTADLVNPDGMPLVWALRAMGDRHVTRVYGPDTMEYLLRAAEESRVPVGFYGGTASALSQLIKEVQQRFQTLDIAFTMSPPFRALSAAEDQDVVQRIAASGARLLFVGLGCPKQEHWIAEHRGRIPAVMLAVGAAFDFFAGTKPQAPRWMMRNGLEWVFRLASEPRRLVRRYVKHNPRFMALFLRQWLLRSQPNRP
jgi:N-acetylglucosaminyldiphosphoundecaprenol N-acetyl-beta-D-mannosaminyltransferase